MISTNTELLDVCKEMYDLLKDQDHDCRWTSGGDFCRGCADLQRWEEAIRKAENEIR